MFRDPGGLLLLLIMPTVLILVMSLVQDAPFKDLQDVKFNVLLINKDKGEAGKQIAAAIDSSRMFDIVEVQDEAKARADINAGKEKMGLLIPENATKTLINTSNKVVNSVSSSSGVPSLFSENEKFDSVDIEVFFDPSLKPSFKNSFKFALIQYVTKTKMTFLMDRLSRLSDDTAKTAASLDPAIFDALSVKEESSAKNKMSTSLTSVQHNVPAWALFGMFLIVVPISGNMIREREEGSNTRLKLIPGAPAKSSLGIILFYTLFCVVQFYLMMLVGLYLVPLLGLPKLSLGAHPWAILPLVFSIAFCSTAYGYFIGSVFKTANQAMPVGAISVVILASLGGVWVPLEILPETVTSLAKFTPLYWALDGVNTVFLRNLGLRAIVPHILVMLGLGLLLTVLSAWISSKRRI